MKSKTIARIREEVACYLSPTKPFSPVQRTPRHISDRSVECVEKNEVDLHRL